MAKPPINLGVANFLSGVEEDELYLSVVTLAELRYGIERLAAGGQAHDWSDATRKACFDDLKGAYCLADGLAAAEWGRIKSRGARSGRPLRDMDAWICGYCNHSRTAGGNAKRERF